MAGSGGYVSVSDALGLMESRMRVLPEVDGVGVRDAFSRVLAENVVARDDIPSRNASHMDGYAVRARDVAPAAKGHSVQLRVRGEVRLGESPPLTLGRGEAVAVATGSYLPEGSDTVLRVEDVERRGRIIVATQGSNPWQYVYPAGADVKRGNLILRKGRILKAQDIAMLMLLRRTAVRVFRRPKVALLATGNELTDSSRPRRGQVRNTHGVLFTHVLEEVGCDPVQMGVTPDDSQMIGRSLKKALDRSDVVLMMGGTSVGGHDLGEMALVGLHPDAMIHGVKMDRGRVAGGAVVNGKPIVMLPGPVQGAMNAFLLLGLPLIRKLLGEADLVTRVNVRLTERWEARRRFRDFTKVVYLRVSHGRAGLVAEPLSADTESMSLLIASNAFSVVPEDVRALEEGQDLEAILLPGFSSVE